MHDMYKIAGALIGLQIEVASQTASANLNKAEEFAKQAQIMMDTQLSVSYSDIQTSVVCILRV